MIIAIVASRYSQLTRLLLDLEREVGLFDFRYTVLFIGPSDGEGLSLPIPRDIHFDDP